MLRLLRVTRWRHHHNFHLNVGRQVKLRHGSLQRRLCAADVFGRRFYNMEHDPCRHDAVGYRLQPTNRKVCSVVSFKESEWLTVFPLVGAAATKEHGEINA